MTEFAGQFFQWLNQHPNLAGLATFIISAAESIAIIGTIVPGSVTMTAIGTLAGSGIIPLWPTLFWAIAGAIVGDGISYWIGRYFNVRLNFVWPFRRWPGLLENGQHFFRQHGGKSVFIGRFVGPVRAVVPLIAGMMNMQPLQFTAANIASAILWAPAYMLPGILLGAATLELPAEIAVHAMLILLFTGLLIIICLWSVFSILGLISQQIDLLLTRFWQKLGHSRHFHIFTRVLQHHDPHETHGQLTLAFYFLFILSIFTCLFFYIRMHGSSGIFPNIVAFHLFRSVRNPVADNIMLTFSFLGEKNVLLPAILAISGWLFIRKQSHTALHVLLAGILASASLVLLKHAAHSARPWGVTHTLPDFSFPSGHATLSFVFYGGIALLLGHILPRFQRVLCWLAVIMIGGISISRLYLNAHWLTDIIGGWLLGTLILMCTVISWNRQKEKNRLHATGIILILLLVLATTLGYNIKQQFIRYKQNAQPLEWPLKILSEAAWWQHTSPDAPVYRINRFGLSREILNIQWLASLTEISKTLLENGWQEPPAITWIDALHRISNVNSSEHLPLISPVYLDSKPLLIVVKRIKEKSALLVLRMWDPRIRITGTSLPLWTGTVEIVPGTYSWLFRQNQHPVLLTPELIFNKVPASVKIRAITVHLNAHYHPRKRTILLIRQKTAGPLESKANNPGKTIKTHNTGKR